MSEIPANPFDQFDAAPVANAFDRFDTGQSLTQGPLGPVVPLKIDETSGAPTSIRMGLGLKMTPEGRASYLESKYGKGNVITDKSGDLYYNANPSFQGTPAWTRVNPQGLDFGDIAENVPSYALGAVPTVFAGANPLTVGAAAGAGNLLRQGVSALLPGEDQMGIAQRGLLAGEDAVMGAGTQYGVNKLFGAADLARPHNIIANYTSRLDRGQPAGFVGPTPPTSADQLESALGLPGFFSLGQRTGSKGVLTVEGMARRYPASADIMQDFDQGQVNTMVGKLNDELNRLDIQGWTPEQTGAAVQNAFEGLTNKVLAIRRSRASNDFGNLDMISGQKPLIGTDNIRNTIQGLVTDLDVPGGGDATSGLVSRLKGMLSDFSGSPGTPATPGRYVGGQYVPGTPGSPPTPPKVLTGAEANRLLQVYGNAAKGTGQIFTDIDRAQQRYVAGKVLDALGGDLDAAVQAGGQGGATANALQTARDNYRQNSQYLNSLRETTLGRLFNGRFDPDPEAVVAKIQNMQPSQLKTTLGVLQTADPNIVSKVQASFLRNALDKASAQQFTNATEAAIPGGMPVTQTPFSAKTFLSNLPQGERFDALFANDPFAKSQIVSIARGFQRIATREGEGSPTAPLQWALDLAKGALTFNAGKIAQAGAQIVTTRNLARALTTPQGRQALMTLTENSGVTGRASNKSLQAASYLAGLAATEPGGENVRPPSIGDVQQ
jgi:hypothetical protein